VRFFDILYSSYVFCGTFSKVLADTSIFSSSPYCRNYKRFICWLVLDFKFMHFFAAELSSSSVQRLETISVVAGKVVNLRCTLEASCANRSLLWTHYSAIDSTPIDIMWYNGHKLNRVLVMRGVNVDNDTSNGSSVLTIPKARLEDGGILHCRVSGVKHCQMKFQLIVTGKIYTI